MIASTRSLPTGGLRHPDVPPLCLHARSGPWLVFSRTKEGRRLVGTGRDTRNIKDAKSTLRGIGRGESVTT